MWVYLVPPSESPPEAVQPFRLDYVAWGEGIARLSLEHPNLTAWVIDDFYGNRAFSLQPRCGKSGPDRRRSTHGSPSCL